MRPHEAPQVNLAGIEETVTDKGYSGAVVKRMKVYGVRSYIPEKKQERAAELGGQAGFTATINSSGQKLRERSI